jgi:hypothetical protein
MTRTVKLITFHVFDPRVVEDILDRDLVTIWREEDAVLLPRIGDGQP